MTLAELHHRCVVDAPVPSELSDPEPAWKWSAQFGTPIWRKVPYGDPAAMRAAIEAPELTAPLYMIVQNVNRGRFGRVRVDYAGLVDALVTVEQPDVIITDAEGVCLALVTEEYEILVLRGTRVDWPGPGSLSAEIEAGDDPR